MRVLLDRSYLALFLLHDDEMLTFQIRVYNIII